MMPICAKVERKHFVVPVRFPLALLLDARIRSVCAPTRVPEHLSSEQGVESQRGSND